MGKIIEGKFGVKEEVVYECSFCQDGQMFWLDEEGTITCSACSSKQLPPQDWVTSVQESLNSRKES